MDFNKPFRPWHRKPSYWKKIAVSILMVITTRLQPSDHCVG